MSSTTSLLMGKGSGEMNLTQLRARADDLRRTLDQLIHVLTMAPERLTWPDVLDRFTVANVQLQHLQDQLRPMLRHWVVHPKSVNQANAGMLPIMLATRLLPEMEAEQEALLTQLAAGGGGGVSMDVDAGAAAAGAAGEPLPAVGVELAAVQQQVEAWNARVAALEAVLPPRGSASRREAAAGAAAPPAAGAGAAGAAARAPGAPASAAGAGQEELSGPALLLAAASYGAGLA